MEKYREKLDLTDIREQLNKGDISVLEAGKLCSDRIKVSMYADYEEFGEICFLFETSESFEEIENAVECLYDFGDEEHRILVRA